MLVGGMEPTPEPQCCWCNDTGTYSGPMLNTFYAGPCLVCTPADDEECMSAYDGVEPMVA